MPPLSNVPGPLVVTVAVKVTGWPYAEGFAEVVTAVVVASWLTVWRKAAEAVVLKPVSPE